MVQIWLLRSMLQLRWLSHHGIMCSSWENKRNYHALRILLQITTDRKRMQLLSQAAFEGNGQDWSLVGWNGVSRPSCAFQKRCQKVHGYDETQGEMMIARKNYIYVNIENDHPELSRDNKFWNPLMRRLNGSSKSSSILCWIIRFRSLVFIKLSCSYLSNDFICSRSFTILLFPSRVS